MARDGTKTGGRVKGSINKDTIAKQLVYNNLWDEVADKVTGEGIRKCWEEMNKLTGGDFVKAYLALAEYFKPKLSRSDVKVEVPDSNVRIIMGKPKE